MSYLDFTIYSERLLKFYEEDEKRKQEERKENFEIMNANFEALGEIMGGEFS